MNSGDLENRDDDTHLITACARTEVRNAASSITEAGCKVIFNQPLKTIGHALVPRDGATHRGLARRPVDANLATPAQPSERPTADNSTTTAPNLRQLQENSVTELTAPVLSACVSTTERSATGVFYAIDCCGESVADGTAIAWET